MRNSDDKHGNNSIRVLFVEQRHLGSHCLHENSNLSPKRHGRLQCYQKGSGKFKYTLAAQRSHSTAQAPRSIGCVHAPKSIGRTQGIKEAAERKKVLFSFR